MEMALVVSVGQRRVHQRMSGAWQLISGALATQPGLLAGTVSTALLAEGVGTPVPEGGAG